MTDMQQTRKRTPEEDIRELYSRTAKLNDRVSALLAPSWGSENGIIPTDHPLYVAEKPTAAQQEQAAPVDWQAIVQRRERELKEVGEARHRAETELARLRAGEEDGYDPAVEPTPGQWIERWNRASPEMRLEVAKRAIENAGIASRCFMMAHEKRLEEDREAWVAVARVRDVIADMETITGARHWARILRKALDGPRPEEPDTTPAARARYAQAVARVESSGPRPSTAATQAAEPEYTCRPVDIDGETIRVHGCGEMSDEARAALAEVIRAAKRKMEAERDPAATEATGLREQLLDAITYEMHSGKGPLAVIPRIADAVLAALSAHLDIADAEAWCKTCRRVWEGKTHRCESDAEQRADQLATLLAVILAEFRIHPGTRTATAHVETETLNRWRATLDQHQEQPHA